MNMTMAVLATVVSLNGNWNLQGWPTPVRGSVRTLEEVSAAEVSVPATVPGCYELDLCAAGLLPNLFYANNQYAVRKYEGHQWLYTRKFTAPELPADEKAVLEFDGLDTLCDVFLNGKKVGEANDMFIPHAFDVSKTVKKGENEIAVLFRAPIVESQFKNIAPIGDANSSAELEGFRKPAHMIGWDILPRFVSAGIFRDARLVLRKPERVRDWFCAQTAIDVEKKSAQYLLDLRLEGEFRRLDTSVLNLTVSRKGKTVLTRSHKVIHWAPRIGFGIDNADLWWPLGFGEPALYDAKLEWRDISTGALLAEKSFRFGVRKIEFTLADYEVATKKPGEMLFTVNGKPCFIRGTSWVPTDALHCRDKDRIIPTLELIREANCNMIRVWGGGLYEPELFWDWCDANGIMVWQDFCFACTQYAQNDSAFHELVKKETIEVVKRLRNHASLALYCGNNENDQVFVAGVWRNHGADPNKDVVSRRLLPEIVREFDPTHPYLPSSPFVNEGVIAGRTKSVEGHYYRRWWKGDLITSSHEKFYSEIGCHGCPVAESIREMFSPDCHEPFTSPKEKNRMWDVRYVPYDPDAGFSSSNELVPGEPPIGVCDFNDQWVKRGVCVFEEKAKERDKYTGCRNHRMVLQMHMLFGDIPSDLETFALESQAAQAEGMKFIIEHCRSRKFAKKTGMTWWNMRDGWPIISDSVVDYYGRKKLAYDYIRRSQQNVLAMVDEDGDVLVVNDLLRPVKGHVTLTDAETGKTLFDGDYACGENSVAKAGNVRFSGQGVAKIRYTVEGEEATYDNHYLYGGPTRKYVGEKKIPFKDYCRWMSLCAPSSKIRRTAPVERNPRRSSSEVRAALGPYVDRGEIAGVISVLSDGNYNETWDLFGYADAENRVPMRPDTLFAIFSMSKTVLGAAMMCAIDDGVVSLDDRVSKFLPEFANVRFADGRSPVREITLRDVTSHVDGIGNEPWIEDNTNSLRTLARQYAALHLAAEPGATFRYGTVRFAVAAACIEVATRRRYEDFIKERLFDKLGMVDTTFNPTPEQVARLVKAYTTSGGSFRPANDACARQLRFPKAGKIEPMAGSGLYSTAADMIRFSQMLAHHGDYKGTRVISRQTFDTVFAKIQVPAAIGQPYTCGAWLYGDWFGHEGAMRTDQRANLKTGESRVFFIQTENKAGAAFFNAKIAWHKACDVYQGEEVPFSDELVKTHENDVDRTKAYQK